MHRLFKGLEQLEAHEAGCALSSFGDAADVTEQNLLEALASATRRNPKSRTEDGLSCGTHTKT